ncbi:hypothetical protein VR611_01010 [Aquirufa nivalisilvae]
MKDENKNNDFDRIIGLSGGLDSSFAAYIAKEIIGLRPLLLHVDAGWNTQQAFVNVGKLVVGYWYRLLDFWRCHLPLYFYYFKSWDY